MATTATFSSSSEHSADLTLPAGGLLRADVGICLPWEALPSNEPLRLVEARALMKSSGGGAAGGGGGGGGSVVTTAGIALSVAAGPGSELAREAGGEAWSRVPGFETVRLVPPRCADRLLACASSVCVVVRTHALVVVRSSCVKLLRLFFPNRVLHATSSLP